MTRRRFLALLLTAFLGASAIAAEPPGRVVRVLFIGNSYTYANDLPALVAQLLAPRGIRLEHESVTPGGASLEKQWRDGQAVAAIGKGKWNFVVLQEQSVRPIMDREAMFSAARLLHAEIAKTGAKTLLYETWAAKAVPDQQQKLTDAYETLGRELGATVVPAGEAWKRALAAGMELHGSDGRHPNRLGSYLAACLFARVVSGKAIVGAPPQIIEKDQLWTWPKAADLETLQRLAEETWQARGSSSTPTAGLLFSGGALATKAAEPPTLKNAAAHRADPRTTAEIQQANLGIKSFPNTNSDFATDRADIPAWWQSSLGELEAFLAAQAKKGEVMSYGTSAGGRPLRAVAYGTPRKGRGTTTANGAISFGDIRAWLGPDYGKRVALVFSAIHGGEFEGIVGTMNLLSVLESGADLAGRPQPALAAAAARLDRLIVIPVANPDGRARSPVRMLKFRGGSNHAAEYFNTGAWADGSLIGWPANKEFIPVDFARLQFAGGYFNDAGVNCQHDDFLGRMQPESRALLDLCASERPDLALNFHTGAPSDNYFLEMKHPVIGRAVEAAWAGLYRQVHTALTKAGHRSTTDLAIEADPSHVPPLVPNLDTMINLHAGTLCALVESPSHSYGGFRRDGTAAPTDPLLLLDAHLVLFTAAFDYLADTGGLAVWAKANK